MFCNQCGTEIPENAKFCNNCGCVINTERKESKTIYEPESIAEEPNKTVETKEKPYMKYCDKVKKINKLTLISQFLSVILGLAILFLPIYQCKYEPSLEDIESWEQFGTVLENGGYIIKNFSLADDMGKMINAVMENKGNEEAMYGIGLSIIIMLGIISLITSLIVVSVDICRKLFGSNNEDIAHNTMLKYDEIKLEMTLSEKEKRYNDSIRQSKNDNMIFPLISCVLDVFYCNILSSYAGVEAATTIKFRYMQDFSGVSGFIFILVTVFIGLLIVDGMRKKEEKEMLVSITEEKYQAE